jgi:hypothetical protein
LLFYMILLDIGYRSCWNFRFLIGRRNARQPISDQDSAIADRVLTEDAFE